MRTYIRHPSDIPIEYRIDGKDVDYREHLRNISFGGLAFVSTINIPPGTILTITISLVKPPFQSTAIVKWCCRQGEYYNIGLAYCDREDAFRIRMVEQLCHIEHYKREVLVNEGRQLTGEQAAAEWIARYAASFPRFEVEIRD